MEHEKKKFQGAACAVRSLVRTAGRRALNPRTVLSFTILSGEVRVALPPKHLITVSEEPDHYDPTDIYHILKTTDKVSDLFFRALEAVSSCDCVDDDGCENCEFSIPHV